MIAQSDHEAIAAHYNATPILVGYEDMANPLRVGTIVDYSPSFGGAFLVDWEDTEGAAVWSDLRQHGWRYIFRPSDFPMPA